MIYGEMIERALKGQSVNAAAKRWGIPQSTLDRYVKGESLPTFKATLIIAREAEIETEEAVKILAEEEEKKKQEKVRYNIDRADVAQSVEQLIRNQ
jgi:transcriptional regulator with XRE-family HTH domain